VFSIFLIPGMALAAESQTLGEAQKAAEALRSEVSRLRQQLEELRPKLSTSQQEVARFRTQREGLLSAISGLSAARQEATEQVRKITKRQLAEIKQLTGRPPDSIKRTLVAAWLLLHGDRFRGSPKVTFDESKDWPRCQRMLADEGFVPLILNFDTAILDEVPHVVRYVAQRFFGIVVADSPPSSRGRSGSVLSGDAASGALAAAAATNVSVANTSADQRHIMSKRSSRMSQTGELLSGVSRGSLASAGNATNTPGNLRQSRTSLSLGSPVNRRSSAAPAAPLEFGAVSHASQPCGALFQWMLELLREHLERERLRKELQVTEASLAMADAESGRLESDVAELEASLAKAMLAAEERERALQRLQGEHEQAKRAVQDLKKLEALTAETPAAPKASPPRAAKRREPKPRPIELELSGSMAHIEHQASQFRVNFDKDTTEVLNGDGQQALVLPKIADMVKEHKGKVKFLLEGHRDPEERDGADLARCRAVFEYLTSATAASPGSIRMKGRGSFCGEGRCVVPLPIEELHVKSGPVSKEVEATTDNAKPGLFFEGSQSSLTNENKDILKKMAEWLDMEDDVRVRVEGHTDKDEPSDLGMARAHTVVNHLVSLGVGEARLRPQGCGFRHPSSRLHAALNRRVEVHVD